MVGIAGEDDLDTPDLLSPAAPETKPDIQTGNKKGRFNGGQEKTGSGIGRTKVGSIPGRPKLELEDSAALRDQLTAELKDINSPEEAAIWAQRVMGAKNTLTKVDAEFVEQAFQVLLTRLSARTQAEPLARRPGRAKNGRRGAGVDKSVLALPAPRRIRNREHVKSVAKQPCLVCGRRPADAHHLRFVQSPALGRKVSDEFTIPLCRGHHREVHRCGDEAAWWKKTGIDPTAAARVLWLKTHPLPALPEVRAKAQNEPNLKASIR